MPESIIYALIFFAIPIVTLCAFVVSLVAFLRARKTEKETPGSIPPDRMHRLRIALVITASAVGVLLTIVVGIVALLYMAVAYM